MHVAGETGSGQKAGGRRCYVQCCSTCPPIPGPSSASLPQPPLGNLHQWLWARGHQGRHRARMRHHLGTGECREGHRLPPRSRPPSPTMTEPGQRGPPSPSSSHRREDQRLACPPAQRAPDSCFVALLPHEHTRGRPSATRVRGQRRLEANELGGGPTGNKSGRRKSPGNCQTHREQEIKPSRIELPLLCLKTSSATALSRGAAARTPVETRIR